jgi:peptidoglycan hydrolase FlgJ
MISSGYSASQGANDSYTDLSSLHAIRTVGKEDKSKALEEISKQFESMMVRMMVKSMRDASAVFGEGNYLSSHESDTYQQMYDDQLALTLSNGGGIGIAEIMAKQLKGRFSNADESSIGSKNDLSRNLSLHSRAAKSSANAANNLESKKLAQPLAVEFDGSVNTFVEHLHALAVEAGQQLGVDPKILIAQSALETGWGSKINRAVNSESSLNLFNIKADQRWSGESVIVSTLEFRQGLPVKEQAAFRSYSSLEESFNDYVSFINNSPRYQQAMNGEGGESYIRGLSNAGYATDPNYAEKIMRIADSKELKHAIDRVTNRAKSHAPHVLSQL